MFGLQYNTFLVLAGTGLLGLVSGVIGAFAVLRRRALMGDALSHAALPGLCFAFLMIGHRHFLGFLCGALISGIIGVLCVAWLRHNTRIKEDAAIGLVLSVFFGFGIVLSRIIQDQPTGRQAGLDSYLLGQTAAMVSQDLYSIMLVSLVVLVVVVFLYKEFKILSFDREFAAVLGWPTFWLDLVMMGLLVITTVIGLPAVGVVLMAALLIVPGVSARFWTDRLGMLLFLAGVFGLIAGVAGTIASANFASLPAGPVIVLAGTSIFFISMFFAPRRGIIARVFAHLQLQSKVAQQNLLRSMYELNEIHLPRIEPVNVGKLTEIRAWSESQVSTLLHAAQKRGHVEREGNQWKLTQAGIEAAAGVTRTHRLWETFLIENADIAPDHVDRDADQIEHILSHELLEKLEEHLRAEGRWPSGFEKIVPASPHSIDPAKGGAS